MIFFRLYSSVRRVGDGGSKAETFTRSTEALCVGMLLEAVSVEGQNSSPGEESAASALSHLNILLCSSVLRKEAKVVTSIPVHLIIDRLLHVLGLLNTEE